MQDSAPAHAAKGTIEDLRQRGIFCMQWPSYSPDLNPIEMVWNWMKDWIQANYDENDLRSYPTLRTAITEAWEAVPESYLEALLQEMPIRCQAVIEANGMHTRYGHKPIELVLIGRFLGTLYSLRQGRIRGVVSLHGVASAELTLFMPPTVVVVLDREVKCPAPDIIPQTTKSGE